MKYIFRGKTAHLRVFALAMTLLLAVGLCCPAGSASAEGFLSAHRDEIEDALLAVRESLEGLGEDLTAIREELRDRAAEQGLRIDGEIGGDIAGVLTDLVAHDGTGGLLSGNTIDLDWTLIIDNSHGNGNTNTCVRETSASGTTQGTGLTTTSPKTGDLNNLVLWIVIVAVSALALAATAFFLLRKKKRK